jgi:hypothetical protein
MKYILSLLLLTTSASAAPTSPPSSKFEEVVIWKLSEDLKLNAQTEEDFASALRELNKKKQSALQNVDTVLKKMESAKNDDESKRLLSDYEKALNSYHQVSRDETSTLAKILKPQDLVHYLALKNQIAEKLQKKLTDTNSTPMKSREPVIIEEK